MLTVIKAITETPPKGAGRTGEHGGIVKVRHGESTYHRRQSGKDTAGKMDLPALVEDEILEGSSWWELDILRRQDQGYGRGWEKEMKKMIKRRKKEKGRGDREEGEVKKKWLGREIEPGMTLVSPSKFLCFFLYWLCLPKYWGTRNPKGSLQWSSPYDLELSGGE